MSLVIVLLLVIIFVMLGGGNIILWLLKGGVFLAIIVVIFLFVAACAPSDGSTIDRIFTSSEKVSQRHHKKCTDFGYIIGTDEYSDCRLVLEILRRRNHMDY